eukprot:SAG11_NODE_413_length_9694_cov_2.695675_13_plen_50_part_00
MGIIANIIGAANNSAVSEIAHDLAGHSSTIPRTYIFQVDWICVATSQAR